MAHHQPPQVAANVRSAIQVLNNDILVVALNNNRVRNDANRFAAEFSTCMGETIALMTKVVLEVNERDATRPFPVLLDPLSFSREDSDKYRAIAPLLSTKPDTWRDACMRLQNAVYVCDMTIAHLRSWQGLITSGNVPTEDDTTFFLNNTPDITAVPIASLADAYPVINNLYDTFTPGVLNAMVPKMWTFMMQARKKLMSSHQRMWDMLDQPALTCLSENGYIQYTGMYGATHPTQVPTSGQVGNIVSVEADETLVYYFRGGIYARHAGFTNPYTLPPSEITVGLIRGMEAPVNSLHTNPNLSFPNAARAGGAPSGVIPPGALAAAATATAASKHGDISRYNKGVPIGFFSDAIYPGVLSRVLICETQLCQTLDSVPIWDYTMSDYTGGVGRRIAQLKFADIPDHDDNEAVSAVVGYLRAVFTELRNVGLHLYVFLNNYRLPTERDCVRSYNSMQRSVFHAIRASLRSHKAQIALRVIDTVLAPTTEALSPQHNICFRSLLKIKEVMTADTYTAHIRAKADAHDAAIKRPCGQWDDYYPRIEKSHNDLLEAHYFHGTDGQLPGISTFVKMAAAMYTEGELNPHVALTTAQKAKKPMQETILQYCKECELAPKLPDFLELRQKLQPILGPIGMMTSAAASKSRMQIMPGAEYHDQDEAYAYAARAGSQAPPPNAFMPVRGPSSEPTHLHRAEAYPSYALSSRAPSRSPTGGSSTPYSVSLPMRARSRSRSPGRGRAESPRGFRPFGKGAGPSGQHPQQMRGRSPGPARAPYAPGTYGGRGAPRQPYGKGGDARASPSAHYQYHPNQQRGPPALRPPPIRDPMAAQGADAQTGAITRRSPMAHGTGSQSPSTIAEKVCYNCRQTGHLARDCPYGPRHAPAQDPSQVAAAQFHSSEFEQHGHDDYHAYGYEQHSGEGYHDAHAAYHHGDVGTTPYAGSHDAYAGGPCPASVNSPSQEQEQAMWDEAESQSYFG